MFHGVILKITLAQLFFRNGVHKQYENRQNVQNSKSG